ncbi:hypothetical protein [Enterobacter hormaechei]|uniref:hypothetical protein n=1 Tax=Enterobacter hormaechei TaxID=158836 RepID=UPI0035624968
MLQTTLETVADLINRDYEHDMEFLTFTLTRSDVGRALEQAGQRITDDMMNQLMRRLDVHFAEYEKDELVCRHFEMMRREANKCKKIPVSVATIETILEMVEGGGTAANDPDIVKTLRDLLPS